MNKLIKFLSKPSVIFGQPTIQDKLHWMSDDTYLKLVYKACVGHKLNLDNPKSFNEKLQWLKIHDRNPLYTTLVDKCLVKDWVAERIGADHVTPTYEVWENASDIDISDLPEKFVLKTNNDSGGVVICRDRATFDLDAAKKKMDEHLQTNYFWRTREWPYKNVKPLVFAEEYLDAGPNGPTDYKFMCFGGQARCAFTCTDRANGDLHVDFFDLDWNHLPFTRHYPNADVPPEAPRNLRQMVDFANKLSEGIPFVRADFYEVAGKTYFGELTFFPGSGFEEFDPEAWDEELGSWIELPESAGGWLLMADDRLMWLHMNKVAAADARDAKSTLPQGLVDYKFYCFDGEPRFLYVSKGLEDHATARISFLNLDWTFAPFHRSDYEPFDELPERPGSYDEMLDIARTLSAGIPFVRVDLFEYQGRPRFSEMTFHPCAGFMQFEPSGWDLKLGNMLDLKRFVNN